MGEGGPGVQPPLIFTVHKKRKSNLKGASQEDGIN